MRLLVDLWGYVKAYRRYWLVPLIIAIILVGALVALSATSPVSPFIYPML